MSKSVLAKVHWVPPEKGGRKVLPAGKQYATVSCFQEDAESWLQEAWSIVLEFDEPPVKQGNPSVARARFLVEAAPVDRLKPGRAFDLYEGLKRVATVEIME
jgi:hypothetical protein